MATYTPLQREGVNYALHLMEEAQDVVHGSYEKGRDGASDLLRAASLLDQAQDILRGISADRSRGVGVDDEPHGTSHVADPR